jgi:hypothetical protein
MAYRMKKDGATTNRNKGDGNANCHGNINASMDLEGGGKDGMI